MKRAVLIVAVAALCVAGSAVAEDRNGLIGSGTRAEENAAGQTMGSGGFTTSTQDGGGSLGSGTRSSGQILGSGGRAEDGGQVMGSGGAVTTQNGGYLIGGGRGGYFGSGLAVYELRLFDDLSLLVLCSDEGTLVIPIEE